jgi:membrane associated rhomboid family serine protease
MRDQFQLWLVPAILTALLTFWFRRKLTWSFGWPLYVQSFLVVLAGTIGLTAGPKPIWTCITWALFVTFLILPNLLIKQCEKCLSLLDSKRLLKLAHRLPIFYWGRLGRFWTAVYTSYAHYMCSDEEAGNAVLAPWINEKLPGLFSDQVESVKMTSASLMWDWEKIIDTFYERLPSIRSASLCLQASRAFAETGQFDMATQCLKSANLPNQRLGFSTLNITYLQYFALLGASEYTRTIVDRLSEKRALPKTILDFWWARCLSAQGNNDESARVLRALQEQLKCDSTEMKEATPVWLSRIERQLDIVEKRDSGAISQYDPSPFRKQIEEVWSNYQVAMSADQLALPRRSSAAVNTLLVMCTAGYVLSGCVDLIDNDFVFGLMGSSAGQINAYIGEHSLWILKTFDLNKLFVLRGEFWRLISYMFLHGNFSHLLMNLVGLVWFGRICVGIYGEWRFLVIFFLSGIVGGLAQLQFGSAPAVGASGGVFGVLMAVLFAMFKMRSQLPEQVRKGELRWLTVMAAGQIVLDRFIPGVAGMVHLGGIVGGLVIGAVLFPKPLLRSGSDVPRKA